MGGKRNRLLLLPLSCGLCLVLDLESHSASPPLNRLELKHGRAHPPYSLRPDRDASLTLTPTVVRAPAGGGGKGGAGCERGGVFVVQEDSPVSGQVRSGTLFLHKDSIVDTKKGKKKTKKEKI